MVFVEDKIIRYTLIALLSYYVTSRFFPETETQTNKIPRGDIRGGDLVPPSMLNKILKRKALKVALLSLFGSALVDNFNEEITELLCGASLSKFYPFREERETKLFIGIAEKYNLNPFDANLRKIIMSQSLDRETKVVLLKMKIEGIISGDILGGKRFVVLTLISLLVCFSFSGVTGLTLFLDALYRLMKEGKISKKLYLLILRKMGARWNLFPSTLPPEEEFF